jgi:hypothetical protein
VFLSISLAVVISPLFLLCFVLVLLFSNVPLELWIFGEKKERKFILIAPVLASLRSLAGTFGVCIYFTTFSLKRKP